MKSLSIWGLVSIVVVCFLGCAASRQDPAVGESVVVQDTTSVAVSPAPVQVSQQVQVVIDGDGRAAGEGQGSGALLVGARGCPGLTVHRAGESRSGRALGMALLAVHARPGAELLVDGTVQGETPLTAVGVDAGPRDVTLRNVALGYQCTVRLRAVPGQRYAFQLDLDPPR